MGRFETDLYHWRVEQGDAYTQTDTADDFAEETGSRLKLLAGLLANKNDWESIDQNANALWIVASATRPKSMDIPDTKWEECIGDTLNGNWQPFYIHTLQDYADRILSGDSNVLADSQLATEHISTTLQGARDAILHAVAAQLPGGERCQTPSNLGIQLDSADIAQLCMKALCESLLPNTTDDTRIMPDFGDIYASCSAAAPIMSARLSLGLWNARDASFHDDYLLDCEDIVYDEAHVQKVTTHIRTIAEVLMFNPTK